MVRSNEGEEQRNPYSQPQGSGQSRVYGVNRKLRKSVFSQVPAGGGKTHVLLERVIEQFEQLLSRVVLSGDQGRIRVPGPSHLGVFRRSAGRAAVAQSCQSSSVWAGGTRSIFVCPLGQLLTSNTCELASGTVVRETSGGPAAQADKNDVALCSADRSDGYVGMVTCMFSPTLGLYWSRS